jgi:hypothetical protein
MFDFLWDDISKQLFLPPHCLGIIIRALRVRVKCKSSELTYLPVFPRQSSHKTSCNRVLERFLLVEGILGRPKRTIFSVS